MLDVWIQAAILVPIFPRVSGLRSALHAAAAMSAADVRLYPARYPPVCTCMFCTLSAANAADDASPVRAKPNVTHYSLAALQRMGHFGDFITQVRRFSYGTPAPALWLTSCGFQNVDSLHHHASPSPSLAASSILELHGTPGRESAAVDLR